jgi:hypothetical protein
VTDDIDIQVALMLVDVLGERVVAGQAVASAGSARRPE